MRLLEFWQGARLFLRHMRGERPVPRPRNNPIYAAIRVRHEAMASGVHHGTLPCPMCHGELTYRIEPWSSEALHVECSSPRCEIASFVMSS